jgi:hypothetical protein
MALPPRQAGLIGLVIPPIKGQGWPQGIGRGAGTMSHCYGPACLGLERRVDPGRHHRQAESGRPDRLAWRLDLGVALR